MDAQTLHDLKNPLTVIRCQAQMLQRRVQRGSAPDKDTMLASLETITSMVTRLNTALDDLSIATQEDEPSPQ